MFYNRLPAYSSWPWIVLPSRMSPFRLSQFPNLVPYQFPILSGSFPKIFDAQLHKLLPPGSMNLVFIEGLRRSS